MSIQDDANDLWLASIFTGLMEYAINQALVTEGKALLELREEAGKVIRIKTHQPYYSVYCQIYEDGIGLSPYYDGVVDARIKTSASRLLSLFLQRDSSQVREDLEPIISGDRQLLDKLLAILHRYDIWATVKQTWQQWFPNINLGNWSELLASIKLKSPEWLEAIKAVPVATQDLLLEVRHLVAVQGEVLNELKAMRKSLNTGTQYRSRPRTFLGLMTLIIISILLLSEQVRLPWSLDNVLMPILLTCCALILLWPKPNDCDYNAQHKD